MALAAAVPGGGLLLASPVQAALRLFQLLPSAAFWQAAGNSSLRIFGGFLLSCALAALLAALAAGRPWLRDLLAPPVAAVKAVPVASFIILALVWLDSRSLSLFISALMVFPPVYLNVLEGLCRTDRKLLELARVYRCWKAGAAAGVIGLPAGTIGERLYTAKIYLQTPDLFAWTAVILILAAVFERLFLAAVDLLAGKAGR